MCIKFHITKFFFFRIRFKYCIQLKRVDLYLHNYVQQILAPLTRTQYNIRACPGYRTKLNLAAGARPSHLNYNALTI